MATPSPGPLPSAGESPESGRALRSSVAAAASRVVSPALPPPSLDSGGLASGGADPSSGLGGASRPPDPPAPPQRAAALVVPATQPADGDMFLTQPPEDAPPELTAAGAGRARGRPRGSSGPSRSSAPLGRAPAAAAARLSDSWGRLQTGNDWCLGDTGDSYEDPDEDGRLQLAAPAPTAPALGPRGRPAPHSRGRANLKAMAQITTRRPPAPRLVAQARAAAAGPGEPALSSHAVRQLVSDMLASFGPATPPVPPLPPPSAPGPSAPQPRGGFLTGPCGPVLGHPGTRPGRPQLREVPHS
jgi:hypothetical protein